MVIILNGSSSRRIQETYSFPFFDTSTLHLPLAHVSNLISETIHVSPLITTIKKNNIVSLLFNANVSNLISETIHVSPLITTIKKNNIVSLSFSMRD